MKRRLVALVAVWLATGASSELARAELLTAHLTPKNAAINQGDLTLVITVGGNSTNPMSDTTFVQASATMDFTYDTVSHQLTMTDVSMAGSDLEWVFLIGTIDAKNVLIGFKSNSGPVVVNPATGAFTGFVLEASVDGDFFYNQNPVQTVTQFPTIRLSGTWLVDPFGGVSLIPFNGTLDPVQYEIATGIFATVSGTVSLDFVGNMPGWVFADGFEGGNTSVWSVHSP